MREKIIIYNYIVIVLNIDLIKLPIKLLECGVFVE